jgi:hypothetical protein
MNWQCFALLPLSPVVLLSLVFCVPLTWAQKTPPAKQTSIQFTKPTVLLGPVPETQTRWFFFPKEMPLSFPSNLGQTEAEVRFMARDFDAVFPTNQPVVELSPPKRWLANVAESEHPWTVWPREPLYYAQHLPLVGQTILHVAQQVESHPRITRVIQLLITRPKTTSSGAPRIRANF